jgi:uncharacterized protein YvpB
MNRRRWLQVAAGALAAYAAPVSAQSVMLRVPIYRQEHALTCEAAALRMALGALGTDVSEAAILSRLAREPTPRQVLEDGTVVWGDPDVGFVGAWDGVYLRDGYGVYDGPIAAVAQSFGMANTTHARAAEPGDLYAAVRNGFPVVVWVPYGLVVKGRGAWTTPDGEVVRYVVTEHAVVLSGLTEDGVLYADPLQPGLVSASFHSFEAALAELENRAVVVRP